MDPGEMIAGLQSAMKKIGVKLTTQTVALLHPTQHFSLLNLGPLEETLGPQALLQGRKKV